MARVASVSLLATCHHISLHIFACYMILLEKHRMARKSEPPVFHFNGVNDNMQENHDFTGILIY